MKKSVILIFLVIITNSLYAQKHGDMGSKAFLGIGAGLPYGGFGGQFSYNIANYVGVFGGLGYNLVGLGGNAGVEIGLPSKKQTTFYFTGMYGYNAVTKVKGMDKYTDSYNGPSFGAGIKIHSLRSEGTFWKIALLVPVRSEEYQDTFDAMEKDPSVHIESKPWPVLLTAGINFMLSKKQ